VVLATLSSVLQGDELAARYSCMNTRMMDMVAMKKQTRSDT
jgi:hypothetical protein